VSFHAAYIIEDGIAQESGSGNALVGAYAANLGLQRDMILFLTAASPEELNVLTPEWADRLGLAVTFGDTNWIETSSEIVDPKDDFQDGLTAFKAGDYATALEKWRPLAEQGGAGGQHNLGYMYYNGLGVTQDIAEALKWYRLAADQGHAGAQHNLATKYYYGQGVPQDFVTAHMWSNISNANEQIPGSFRDSRAERMSPADISDAQARARRCMASNYTDCD